MDNYQKNEKETSYWENVGSKFAALGESLREAFEATLDDPRTQDALEQIKHGLNQAADEIDDAIASAKEDPHVKQFTEDANQVFNDLGEVGEETIAKAKPHVVKALKSFSDALNNLINDIDKGADE